MGNVKVLHIGLLKCGSSLLGEVFKKISINNNIKLVNMHDIIDKKKM